MKPHSGDFILPVVELKSLMGEGEKAWRALKDQYCGIVIRTPSEEPSRERILSFANQVGKPRTSVLGVHRRNRGATVHDVAPRQEVRDFRGVVVLSTTYREIPLHSDGYNAEPPPEQMILQMVNPGKGGSTTAALAGDIMRNLSLSAISCLSERVFPTTDGTTAIVTRHRDGTFAMRFNEYEINNHLAKHHNCQYVKSKHVAAFSELVEMIDYFESSVSATRIQLRRSDVLLLKNGRVLHGRLGLERSDHARLLHRVWC